MKTFHRSPTVKAEPTFTVQELIDHLKGYDASLPVLITWEDVLAPVNKDSFCIELAHKGLPSESTPCLIVLADTY